MEAQANVIRHWENQDRMRRILFVDDEPNVLEGLQRMLWPMRKQWAMQFARSGQDALTLMDASPFDVIVTDIRMPGMDGAELLKRVREKHPDTVRFVLSGQSDEETIFRSVEPAHQFLSKPCNAAELKSSVERAFALRDLLGNRRLAHLVSQIGALPVLPQSYTQLTKELESPNASVASVAKIIEADVAMTAKVLQWINSAFFGIPHRVTSANQAVSLLGLDIIKALVLVVGVFHQIGTTLRPSARAIVDRLWMHSMTVAVYAQEIARAENTDIKVARDAFTAGVLHDTGILILTVNYPDDTDEITQIVDEERIPLSEVELEVLGCTHGQVGAYLLGIWGLPDSIVEAVAFHHHPTQCLGGKFAPLAAVHMANALDFYINDRQSMDTHGRVDTAYLDKLGLTGRVPAWHAACAAVSREEVSEHA